MGINGYPRSRDLKYRHHARDPEAHRRNRWIQGALEGDGIACAGKADHPEAYRSIESRKSKNPRGQTAIRSKRICESWPATTT